MTKQTRNLLILFLTIFIVKASISFFMSGTYFYSDEACVVIKAKHFAETLQMLPCKEIAHAPANDPMPLYSIIIAPFFFFFKGFTSYQAVLVFNSLAISSLVFPLYWITKNFIKKEWIAYLIISVTLFLPQITVYEKMLLTESFFVFLNIWLLYFYGKYKTEKKDTRKYLLLTILFTILAGLERPFGFITTLALISNEIITSRNRKKIVLILTPVAIIIFFTALTIVGNTSQITNQIGRIFYDFEFFKNMLFALKNQLNSLTITTLLIPILILANNFHTTKNNFFTKTKWYLLALILFNLLISSNHIYGYIISNHTTDLLTRYINISIIIIFFFSLNLYLSKDKKQNNKLTFIITSLCIFSLIFLKSETVKHSLNLDLSIFYNIDAANKGNLITQNKILEYLLFPSLIILFSLFIFEKKKTLIILLSIIFATIGISNYFWNIKYSHSQNLTNETKYLFRDKELNIFYLQPEYASRVINFIYWDLSVLTKNRTHIAYFDVYKTISKNVNFYTEKKKTIFENFDIILSDSKLSLPLIYQTGEFYSYYPPQGQSYQEHIELLKAENKPFIEPSEPSKENDPQSTPSLTPQENDKEQS